jgi:hypothetical protein
MHSRNGAVPFHEKFCIISLAVIDQQIIDLLQMRLLPQQRQQQQQTSRDTEVGLTGVGGHALGGGGISTTQNSLLLLNPDTLQPITWEQVDVPKSHALYVCLSTCLLLFLVSMHHVRISVDLFLSFALSVYHCS